MSDTANEAIQDGCYYLHKLGFSYKQLSEMFVITEQEALDQVTKYQERMEKGELEETPIDARFWEDLVKESMGNTRITLVNEKGHFYHGRRTDLETMKTSELMALFEVNKDFLLKVPQVVLDSLKHHKVGYNPLLPFRQVQDSLKVMEEILEKRED